MAGVCVRGFYVGRRGRGGGRTLDERQRGWERGPGAGWGRGSRACGGPAVRTKGRSGQSAATPQSETAERRGADGAKSSCGNRRATRGGRWDEREARPDEVLEDNPTPPGSTDACLIARIPEASHPDPAGRLQRQPPPAGGSRRRNQPPPQRHDVRQDRKAIDRGA